VAAERHRSLSINFDRDAYGANSIAAVFGGDFSNANEMIASSPVWLKQSNFDQAMPRATRSRLGSKVACKVTREHDVSLNIIIAELDRPRPDLSGFNITVHKKKRDI